MAVLLPYLPRLLQNPQRNQRQEVPSINAECTEQTVEYEAGGIRYLSQELLSSETYTWSTIGQTEEVGH